MEKLVPRLRFPGFEGNWEKKKLGDLSSDIMYGMNASAIPYDGTNKYIRITDIDDSSRTFLPSPLTSPDGTLEEKYKLRTGDIVFTRTGASVGKSYLYSPKDGNLFFAGFLIRFNVTTANPYFVYTHTLKDSYDKWVKLMSMRSGQPGINAEEYKTLDIYVTSSSEQNKIADFLRTVDAKLNHLKKKKSLLEQYKKGMMQKIFDREVRFRDDDGNKFSSAPFGHAPSGGEWDEKTIGDIVTIKYGKDQKQVISENGRYPILGTGGEMGRTNEFLCDKPSVLIGRKGTIDKPMYMETPFWTVDTLFYTDIKTGNSPKWVFYLFQTINWYLYNEASGVPSLSSSTINKIPAMVPGLKEQTKIANFLSAIDDKINLVGEQVEGMEKFKKGLLREMFV